MNPPQPKGRGFFFSRKIRFIFILKGGVLCSKINKIIPFAIPVFFTIFYFLFTGYRFAVSDEGGWIVYLNKKLDPTLYENDYLWSSRQNAPHEQFSIFSDIDFWISSIFSFNFPFTHFLLLFVTKYLLFLTVYFGSLAIFKNKSAAILAGLAFIPSYFFLGPLVGSNENTFTPRVMVQPLILSLIFLVFASRRFLASFLAGLSFAIHAVSVLPILPMVAIANFIKRPKLKTTVIATLVILVGILPLAIKLLIEKPTGSLLDPGPISDYLKEVVLSRKGYLIISNWNNRQWLDTLAVFALGLPFLVYVKNGFNQFKVKILIFYLAIIFSNFLYFLTTDIFRLGLFLPIQFPRSLVYIYAINLILVCGTIAYFLNRKYLVGSLVGIALIIFLFLKEQELFYLTLILFLLVPFFERPWPKITLLHFLNKPAVIFFVGVMILTVYTLYQITSQYSYEKIYGEKKNKLLWREFLYDRVHFTLPKGDISAQLQLWVRDNTPKDAVILVDSDLGFFRIYSQRAVVFDHKDLGYVYYSDQAARKIQEREADVADFEHLTEDQIIKLKDKYHFDYLVWKENRGMLPFEKVYNQFGFTIYKL